MQNPLPTLSERAYSGISLVLFLGLSVVFFQAFFFEITLPVHQWAQADRLAIAFIFKSLILFFSFLNGGNGQIRVDDLKIQLIQEEEKE